jgi:hypothetical protein
MTKVAMLAGLIAASKRFALALALGAAALATAEPVRAQINHGLLTGAERGSNGQSMILLGGWAGVSGLGWNPVAGVIGYRLDVSAANDDVSWAANPFLGLRHQWRTGGAQMNLGYSFTRAGASDGVGAPRVYSGLTTGAQIDWGANSAVDGQIIASDAWSGDGYAWSRARLGTHMAGTRDGAQLRAAAEVSLQGDDTYTGLEAGPLLQWRSPGGVTLGAGAGWRRAPADAGQTENLSYFRVEMVIAR